VEGEGVCAIVRVCMYVLALREISMAVPFSSLSQSIDDQKISCSSFTILWMESQAFSPVFIVFSYFSSKLFRCQKLLTCN
jgi:hypothetical protein